MVNSAVNTNVRRKLDGHTSHPSSNTVEATSLLRPMASPVLRFVMAYSTRCKFLKSKSMTVGLVHAN